MWPCDDYWYIYIYIYITLCRLYFLLALNEQFKSPALFCTQCSVWHDNIESFDSRSLHRAGQFSLWLTHKCHGCRCVSNTLSFSLLRFYAPKVYCTPLVWHFSTCAPGPTQSSTACARIHASSFTSVIFKMRDCTYFIHRPRRYPSQLQAVLYASAVPSRIPAYSVVALLAAIGSGSVGKKIRITRGWRAWMPAKVSLAN